MYQILLLILCLVASPLINGNELNIRATGIDRTDINIVREWWSSLEKRFGKKIPSSLDVKIFEDTDHYAYLAGKNFSTEIRIHPKLKGEQRTRVIRHEVSHAFLNAACPVKFIDKHLVHESFALWTSGDYKIKARQTKMFAYKSQAQRWLDLNQNTNSRNRKLFEEAISRLLFIPQNKEKLEKIFRNIIYECLDKESEIKKIFSIDAPQTISFGENFLVIDRVSTEILVNRGETDVRFPVGSTLKPLLLALNPPHLEPVMSQKNIYWACPQISEPKIWNWRDALIKSCNGFFLNHELAREFYQKLKLVSEQLKIDFSERRPTISQMTGVVNGISISLKEMLLLYEWIDLTYPQITQTLMSVPITGTLSTFSHAKWFIDRGFMMKSGSVRTAKGEPVESWIVALNKTYSVVIHSKGRSTEALMQVLYDKLSKMTLDDRYASIQVLGLVPEEKIKIGCENQQGLMISTKEKTKYATIQPLTLADLKTGSFLRCIGGPLVASFPLKNGKIERRKYRGRFSVYDFNESDEVTTPKRRMVSERRRRARRGSRLVFETSLREAIIGTIYSEFPNGREETLKALAFAIANNIYFKRHESRSICDTTHCQVYGRDLRTSKSLRRKIERVVDIVLEDLKSYPLGQEWFAFALGGKDAWTKNVSFTELSAKLGISFKPTKIIKDSRKIIVGDGPNEKKFDCEFFRNQLNLNSCPEIIDLNLEGAKLSGKGEGHGLGLKLEEADYMALQGRNYKEIVKFFYGKEI